MKRISFRYFKRVHNWNRINDSLIGSLVDPDLLQLLCEFMRVWKVTFMLRRNLAYRTFHNLSCNSRYQELNSIWGPTWILWTRSLISNVPCSFLSGVGRWTCCDLRWGGGFNPVWIEVVFFLSPSFGAPKGMEGTADQGHFFQVGSPKGMKN